MTVRRIAEHAGVNVQLDSDECELFMKLARDAAKTTYSDYHDIHSGTNGTCGALCTSVTGYDTVTGIGSPKGSLLIPALASH